jgi:hypothetical protein
MNVDNNHDRIPDIVFQFRFTTEIRLPGVFTGLVGGIAGIPPITALNGPGSEGLSLRQGYSVTMIKNSVATNLTQGKTLYAVPSNVGPLTMPDYNSLFNQGICDLVTAFASLQAQLMTPSPSTLAQLSTRSTSAWELAGNPYSRRRWTTTTTMHRMPSQDTT